MPFGKGKALPLSLWTRKEVEFKHHPELQTKTVWSSASAASSTLRNLPIDLRGLRDLSSNDDYKPVFPDAHFSVAAMRHLSDLDEKAQRPNLPAACWSSHGIFTIELAKTHREFTLKRRQDTERSLSVDPILCHSQQHVAALPGDVINCLGSDMYRNILHSNLCTYHRIRSLYFTKAMSQTFNGYEDPCASRRPRARQHTLQLSRIASC
ncbi:hypothetical protein BDW22DRAFT_877144 [Trametopsis cervina]|nr:hypothetical protein BDW22DRAFT_877144 [Trametopsis cervina]